MLTIRDYEACLLAGWQAECAVQSRATHLVASLRPRAERGERRPEHAADAIEEGRAALRAHLARVRGSSGATE